jgi:hypothetical protein
MNITRTLHSNGTMETDRTSAVAPRQEMNEAAATKGGGW